MKTKLFFFYSLFLITINAQEIFFSRDSLGLNDDQFIDSLVIFNHGTEVLQIDSIKCDEWNYQIITGPNMIMEHGTPILDFVLAENILEITPGDSLVFRITPLAILVKESRINYNQIDTMKFFNNSINSPVYSLVISNNITMGGVEKNEIPSDFKLYQNYPNPFNPSTIIKYNIPSLETGQALSVQLKIYDILGNEIATLVNKKQLPGLYEIQWNAENISSGVYFYSLITGNYIITKSMILLK